MEKHPDSGRDAAGMRANHLLNLESGGTLEGFSEFPKGLPSLSFRQGAGSKSR
jgi:hypothetical protein